MRVRLAGIFDTNYGQDMAIIRSKMHWALVIASLALLFALPTFIPNTYLSLLSQLFSVIIATLGIQILTGYGGQISIGHSSFVAIGAYTTTILMVQLHFPFWAAIICGGIMSGIVGAIFGCTSLRIKGFYMVMSTLAAQFLIMYFISHWSLTGGNLGLEVSKVQLFGMELNTPERIFCLSAVALALSTFLAKNITRTRMGRAFVAVRDNDLAAKTLGINVAITKIWCFFTGCFFAGIGGGVWSFWLGWVEPTQFTLLDSLWYLAYIIVGGMGSIAGCFFGAITIMGTKEALSRVLPAVDPTFAIFISPATTIFFGLVIVAMLIFEPRGINHTWETFKNYYRTWPLAE